MRSTGLSSLSAATSASAFGALLRQLREAAVPPRSQSSLAEALNRSTSFVSLLETGQRQPSQELVHKLADALHLGDDDRRRLMEAAGFPGDAFGAALEALVSVIYEGGPAEEIERDALKADLEKMATRWREIIRTSHLLRAGALPDAHATFKAIEGEITDHPDRYSPAMRTYARVGLVDTLLRLGDLESASHEIRKVRDSKDVQAVLPEAHVQVMEAELSAKEATVLLDQGQFDAAGQSFKESRDRYMRLASTSPDRSNLVAIGLGWSYKRLAQLSVIQGHVSEALKHCETAERHFKNAVESPGRAEGLRRVREITAWAHAVGHNYAMAEELHEVALEAARTAGDDLGIVQNTTYLADDLLGRVEYELDQLRGELPLRGKSPRALMEVALHRDRSADSRPLLDLLAAAGTKYREVIERSRELGAKRLLARALRNSGVTYHLLGEFQAAQDQLEMARAHDEESDLKAFVPAVYQALGDLAWDQKPPREARRCYEHALDTLIELEKIGTRGAAAGRLRSRIVAAKEAIAIYFLEEDERGIEDSRARLYQRWTEKARELKEVVQSAIVEHSAIPISTSDKSLEWMEELERIERVRGGRILAQNLPSLALAKALPPGYIGVGEAHERRRLALMQRLADARASGSAGDRYRDLCCRMSVETSLGEANILDRVAGAQNWLTEYAPGYELVGSMYALPLGFAVKGSDVWIELPGAMAPLTSKPVEARDSALEFRYGYYGYHITDDAIAGRLLKLFDQLVDLAMTDARNIGLDNEVEWLERCTAQRPVHFPGVQM